MRILQISDTHLYATREVENHGVCTYQTLVAVLDQVRTLSPPPVLIVMTGDLVDDGSDAGYHALLELLSTLDVPIFCIPGNHDDPQRLRRNLSSANVSVTNVTSLDHWQFLFLDTHVPGSAGGHLAHDQLSRLEANLSDGAASNALIFLHHHPVAIGSAWMDTMRLDNPQALFAIVQRHPQVRAVAWGHVHQEYAQQRDGVKLLAAPSTCVQFKPGSVTFALDELAAGYRWFDLDPDGGIRTGVTRIG